MQKLKLIRCVLNFKTTPPPTVPADHVFADKILLMAGEMLDDGTFTICMNNPAAVARNVTNGFASVSSWALSEAQYMVKESYMLHRVEMTKENYSRHAHCNDIGPEMV